MIALFLTNTDALTPLSGPWLDYAKTLLVLGGISMFAFVAARFWLPRLAQLRNPKGDHIQIFARYPLEPRKSLYVVKAGKSMMLLASSEDGVHFMTALDAADFERVTQADVPSAGGSSFRRLLKSAKS